MTKENQPQGAGSGEPAAPATGRECWVRFVDYFGTGVEGHPAEVAALPHPARPGWVRMVEPPPSSQVIGEDGEPSGTASLRGAARLEEPGLKFGITNRRFALAEFKDRYGANCSIQKSSLATEDCIWLGIDDPPKQHMGEWLGQRMHLTQEMVSALLPALQYFASTGDLPPAARSDAPEAKPEGPSPSSPPSPAPTPKDDLEAMFQAGFYADARALYEDALEAARAALPAPASQGAEAGEVNREFENMVLRERREFKERAIAAEAKVETLEADLRKSYEGKVNFDRLRQDLARASGLDCYAHTWDAHIEAIVAMRQAATPASPEALAALQAVERAPEAPALAGAVEELEEARAACTRYKGYLPTVIKELEGDLKILEEAAPSAPAGLRDAKRVEERPTLAEAIAACPVLAALTETHDAAFCSFCLAMEPKAESSPPLPFGEGSRSESSPVPPAGPAVDLEAIRLKLQGEIIRNGKPTMIAIQEVLSWLPPEPPRLRSPGGSAHG